MLDSSHQTTRWNKNPLERPTWGVLDPDFQWKILPYPEILWKTLDFPIPNFPPCHPVEYFVFDWEPSLKYWQLSSTLESMYHDMIRPTRGVLDTNFLGRVVFVFYRISPRIFCPDIMQSFHIFLVYRIEKLRNSRYHGCISSRFP